MKMHLLFIIILAQKFGCKLAAMSWVQEESSDENEKDVAESVSIDQLIQVAGELSREIAL